MRKGVVLSSRSILKLDRLPPKKTALSTGRTHFGGTSNSFSLETLAPNYRRLIGLPISGVAQPTIEEIKSLLISMGSGISWSGVFRR